ncbi:smu-2, partial [Symbiodinium sp. KB8]
MDQAAFRAMVAAAGSTVQEAPVKPAKVKQAQQRPKHGGGGARRRAHAGDQGGAASSAANYTDRAALRRAGDSKQASEQALYDSVDAAKSQYLGGDAQHTHLVKGLDKSLLKQERLRLQSETVAANPQRTAPSLDAPAALAGSGPDTFEAFHAAAAGRAAAAMRGGGVGQRTHTALGGEVLALLESVEYNAGEAAKYALPGATPPSQAAGGSLASALSAALGLKTASGHAKWHPGRTTLQYSLAWA